MTWGGGSVRERKADRDRQARILDYWRAVEYFSPPTVKDVNPSQNRYAVHARRPLPWETGSELGRKDLPPDRVWQHTVYAGIFPVKAVRDVLEDVFRSPEEEKDFDGRVKGNTALLSFTVTQTGQLIKSSIGLSACAWAVGRTLSPGPHDKAWLDGWEMESARVQAKLLDLGDGDVKISFGSEPGGSAAPGTAGAFGLGPIAGSAARILLDAAASGLDAAATVAGTAAAAAVGGIAAPVTGAVVTKTLSGIGDGLVDAARSKLGGAKDAGQNGDGAEAAGDIEAGEHEPPPIGTKALTVDDLAAITRWVAETLGVGERLRPDTIRVQSYQVSVKKSEEAVSDGILNSFFAEDLDRVSKAAASGGVGKLLTEYLSREDTIDVSRRIDVRQSLDIVHDQVQPSALPLGRWPGQPDRPLSLSQQFAVNRLMAQLGAPDARGSYAVNGPPGTGKSTMLRDIVAAVVVRRAEVLARLAKPDEAFQKTELTWQTLDGAGKPLTRRIRPLIPELTGFEMVVASSNNGAVNNITLEIPALSAVEGWEQEASYLRAPASNLSKEPVWGAVAARLGRLKYRRDFVQNFFWASDDKKKSLGLHYLLKQQADQKPASGKDQPAPLGTETWGQAKKRFQDARRRVEDLVAERQQVADLIAGLSEPDATLARLITETGDARRLLATHQASLATQTTALETMRDDRRAAEARLAGARLLVQAAESAAASAQYAVEAVEAKSADLGRKPGRVRNALSRNDLRGEWTQKKSDLAAEMAAADAVLQTRLHDLTMCHRAVQRASKEVTDAEAAVRSTDRRLADTRCLVERLAAEARAADSQRKQRIAELRAKEQQVADARARWRESVPGEEWAARSDGMDTEAAMERRELSAPWMDAELAEARTRLFLAALALHRALFANAAGTVRTNLIAAMDVVQGAAPADLPAATVLAGWQLLFLVVPVVSSTFASIGRMLSRLGPESLGWLFVDEAGQAAPQQAVGALWRFQRAVIVGDPLQLEPVVTLPWTAQVRLARRFGVGDEWAPSRASVQTLADRLAECGTWLNGADGEKTWVASPLRVHRRCDWLMFDVSNKIAYDGMMVDGVGGVGGRKEYPFLGRSGWSHIAARSSGDKWNPAEGKRVVGILGLLAEQIAADLGSRTPKAWRDDEPLRLKVRQRMAQSVFVVSPFADVARGLERLLGDWLPTQGDDSRVGTVHVTQGKEADVVVLVLGTGAGQDGSRRWAAQRPNLLNVAVTRAKRRLIVVGDHTLWSQLPYFSVLGSHEALGEVVGLD